jgi:hypothetical protein
MADTISIRHGAPARDRLIGLGVAFAAHLAILAGFILAIQIPRLTEPPAIEVSLVPAFPAETEAPHRRAPPPPPRPERAVAPRQVRLVGPEVVTPLPIPAAPPDAAARARLFAAPFVPHEPVREGLRSTTGCTEADLLKLSPGEREACRKRNHDLGAGAPVYAVGPSDPVKRAYLDKQAAKNEARRRMLEAPPTPAMKGCADSRFSNLGFSCTP